MHNGPPLSTVYRTAEKGSSNCNEPYKEGNSRQYLALLERHNTLLPDKLGSPVECLMGQRTKKLLSTCEKLLQPKTISPKVVYREMKQKSRTKI